MFTNNMYLTLNPVYAKVDMTKPNETYVQFICIPI